MTYLRNAWYMAGWMDEVTVEHGLARTLLDEPVYIYRDVAGEAHALLDRCPHRFAPLSMGRRDGDVVVCAYHGLGFGGAGRCVRNPHGPVTRSLDVRSYPVAEAHRILWIWMGDPALADPMSIMDLSFLSSATEASFNNGYINGHGHYQLFVDNILDLSHTDYLHPDTLGGGAISRTRAKVMQRDDGVISIYWHVVDDVPTPLFRQFLPEKTDRVDSWTEVDWTAPGVMKLVSGAVETGGSRAGALNVENVHIFTPNTSVSTHYFFASTRNFGVDNVTLNESIRTARARIFSSEDEPMIAAQQQRMGDRDFWSLRPALLRTDEGAVKVRRRMDELIAREASELAINRNIG
ncbi:aromatic ring-hydroxylating dioxygenase subunit alpha [Sphingomonas sp. QA11]|uniref:aromatic ring-hydroxylating dioxygenase subunit alpha n=1 Tax=Sphingomonas sp. QA11 TaxID=2950605 RepID=UPI0023493B1B|nr:aromatic ring-hydroxylating dioxygenase subunit alpha [Sphingomonas sp. QA11]WCM25016.1 aromatic ring-hydroxylating dioxygenase subunit alpha [Sphingomonas sp. QA11]